MSNDKVRKFLFPVEEEIIPDTDKVEPKFESNRDLYHSSNDDSVLNNQLYGGNEQKEAQPAPKNVAPANTMVFNPTAHEDAETIAQQIILGNAVIVNLEHLLKDEQSKLTARRIIDFVCGVAFALSISVKKINASTFLISKDVK